MSYLNKVMLIGNVGKVDTKTFGDGNSIVNISLATSSKYRNNSGEMIENTEWHNVVLYKKLAEIAQQYCHKGQKVYIEGSIKTEKWQDKSGQDRFTTKIIGHSMQMLSKSDGAQQAPKEVATQQYANKNAGAPFDDDIPF